MFSKQQCHGRYVSPKEHVVVMETEFVGELNDRKQLKINVKKNAREGLEIAKWQLFGEKHDEKLRNQQLFIS